MGTSKRYAAQMDARNEERFRELADIPRPVTLPRQAYGGEPSWAPMDDRPPVWVWVQWTAGVATREAAYADGWTDRVVLVTLESDQWSLVVWRNAVTRRAVPPSPIPGAHRPVARSAEQR